MRLEENENSESENMWSIDKQTNASESSFLLYVVLMDRKNCLQALIVGRVEQKRGDPSQNKQATETARQKMCMYTRSVL
jgi:hypothetical protein